MKQYDIAWLAEEAGLQMAYPVNHPIAKFIVAIEARAAAKEREACANVCEDREWGNRETYAAQECVRAIRARGKA